MSWRWCLVLLIVLVPSPAYAYLDPGTGSILLQALLAGFAGLGVVGKLFWHKLRIPFKRTRKIEQNVFNQSLPDSEVPAKRAVHE